MGPDLAPQHSEEGVPQVLGAQGGGRRLTHLPCFSLPPGSAPTGRASCPGRSQVLCIRAERGSLATAAGPRSRSRPAGQQPPLHPLHGPPPPLPRPCLPPPGCEWRPSAGALSRALPSGRASPYVRARGGAARPSGRRGGRGLDGAGAWAGQESPGLWELLGPCARACCCSRFFNIWRERPVSLAHMEWNDSAGPEPRDLTSAPPAEPRSTFLLRPVTVSQPRLY